MNTSLAERYTYGVGSNPEQFDRGELVGASADFFYGIPERQKEMIGLMQTQIKLQETAARDIAKSNIASAGIIASEIEKQTSAMESTVERSTDRVLYKLEDLENGICGELSDISWELVQIDNMLSEKLDDIITILESPRKTEASELTQQGVRHLANNEISEAEDRLMKALEKDTTDYVTLMNLGFLYVQKNQSDDAIKFFNKSITLSPNINNNQKSYSLWCISRVLYATSQYKECCKIAQESVNLDPTPKKVYSLGVYKILAGYKSEGFELLNKAISQDVSFFALTATDPDLKEYKNDVLAFLDKIYQQKYSEAKNKFQELKDFLSSVSTTLKNLSSVPPPSVDKTKYIYKECEMLLDKPIYSNIVAALERSVDKTKSIYKECEMLLDKPIYSNIVAALESLNYILVRRPRIERGIKFKIEKESLEAEIIKVQSLEEDMKKLEINWGFFIVLSFFGFVFGIVVFAVLIPQAIYYTSMIIQMGFPSDKVIPGYPYMVLGKSSVDAGTFFTTTEAIVGIILSAILCTPFWYFLYYCVSRTPRILKSRRIKKQLEEKKSSLFLILEENQKKIHSLYTELENLKKDVESFNDFF